MPKGSSFICVRRLLELLLELDWGIPPLPSLSPLRLRGRGKLFEAGRRFIEGTGGFHVWLEAGVSGLGRRDLLGMGSSVGGLSKSGGVI